MFLNKRHQKALRIFWVVVSALTIIGMVLLYVPTLF
jgi:predicted nucleic acid-binding Zn ribbon protein